MRILVRAEPSAGSRLNPAAAGLALRGHQVAWIGADPPAEVEPVGSWIQASRRSCDLVVAASRSVVGTVGLARLCGARAVVIGVRNEWRWSWADRWAWHVVRGIGLVESAEADHFRAAERVFGQDRLALWSDGPPASSPASDHLDTEILERACERALSRAVAGQPRSAVFVDRDGTLVREVGYLSDPADLELLPGVARALRQARAAGHPVVVISNQSGVGRGLFPAFRVHEAMARLRRMLRAEGVELDAVYFCPHRPEEGCPCRKPRPGLLHRAAEDQRLSLSRSMMVGDKLLDVECARAAGALGVLVRTGYGRDEEQRWRSAPPDVAPRGPDAVLNDVGEAVAWFLYRAAPRSSS